MKHTIVKLTLISYLILSTSSCSKHEEIRIDPKITSNDTATRKVIKMFIGVHVNKSSSPGLSDLIVGYTNSDSSFTRSDSVSGSFYLNPNMDKHTSCRNASANEMYFVYRHLSNNNLMVGVVNTVSGKYLRSLDLGVQQTDMIHLQYNPTDDQLYFSMGQTIYKVDRTNGALTNVQQQQSQVVLPVDYPSSDFYLSHLLISNRFSYISKSPYLLNLDLNTQTWDTLVLPNSGSYRSLIADPSDPNILYTYNLVTNTNYNLVKVDLSKKLITNVVTQNPNCYILWFQASYHPNHKLYSCLPFEHQIFPYYITINVNNGQIIKYPSPSVAGQCILD